MTNKELAQKFNGSEYPFEPKDIPQGFVVVFPDSDDLMEFRGEIEEEFGAYNGHIQKLDRDGVYVPLCNCEDCPHEEERVKGMPFFINQIWDDQRGWSMDTNIPSAEKFEIMEDGRIYGVGLVFRMGDLASTAPQQLVAEKDAEIERLKSIIGSNTIKSAYLQQEGDMHRLTADNQRLREALGNLLEIVRNTNGVTGWHQNGDVAAWAEFEDVAAADQLLAATEQDPQVISVDPGHLDGDKTGCVERTADGKLTVKNIPDVGKS